MAEEDTAAGSNSNTNIILQNISHISQNKYFLVTDFEKKNHNNELSSSSKIINVKAYLWKQWQSMIDDLIMISTTTKSTTSSSSNSNKNNDMKQQEGGHNQNHYYYKEWFDKIYGHYNEPNQRYYHTPVHLYEMFEYLSIVLPLLLKSATTTTSTSSADDGITEQQQQQQQQQSLLKPVLMLAIFFHDVIYDAKSNTNEKGSFDLFLEFAIDVNKQQQQQPDLLLLLPSKVIGQVKTLILATIKHKPIVIFEDNDDEYCTIDIQKIFLDIDMAVLGKSSQEAYLSYASAIRKEYIWVEHDIYCTKRVEVLQTFLNNHTQIYMSNIFHSTLESYARQNLQMEIILLQKGTIPGDDEKI